MVVTVETEALIALFSGGSAVIAAGITGVTTWLAARGSDERAERRELRRAEREDRIRQRELAASLADEFRDQIVTIRKDDRSTPLDVGYLEAWWESYELNLRQLIDRVSDRTLRRRLLLVAESVPDGDMFDRAWGTREQFILRLLSLGRDLAMAGARDQEPDDEVLADYDRIEAKAHNLDAHREQQALDGQG